MHDVSDEPVEITGADTFVPVAEPLSPGAIDGTAPPGNGCTITVKEGCYRLTFRPSAGFQVYEGTLRVDKRGGQGPTTVSGDLYRFLNLPQPGALPAAVAMLVTDGAAGGSPLTTAGIPVFPRNKYHSYLKGVGMAPTTTGPCQLVIRADEFVYTPPPAGSFDGSFPSSPTRRVTLQLTPAAPPVGAGGPFFTGTLSEGAAARGTVTLGWVSDFFRRATLEVDTLAGSVTPQPVPAHSGTGTEDFRTVFATAGWDLTVIRDQANIPVPPGITPNECWSSADMHDLMEANRNPAADLDQAWWLHLLVVPAQMGCGRGVMYDTIGVPREGVASFSDDGYPPDDSANFGAAANRKQRDVPRAFMRSACHEVGHGFNQQHQEITAFGEPGADNSIMTTSPGVADVLRGPTTGAPGVFPDDIRLGFNDHVRHHLVHFPDPVVRPGGMTFGTGHDTTVPQSDGDRLFFGPDQLALTLTPAGTRVKLGQPLAVAWELTNKTGQPIPVPADLRRETMHAQFTVVNPNGVARGAPPAAVMSDAGGVKDLPPGEARAAKGTLFYSSKGFAFRTPGQHTLRLRVVWDIGGVPVGVRAEAFVWVDYPVSDADNEVAALMMHPEVGAMVATGGRARHRPEAGARVEEALKRHPEHPVSKAMSRYAPGK